MTDTLPQQRHTVIEAMVADRGKIVTDGIQQSDDRQTDLLIQIDVRVARPFITRIKHQNVRVNRTGTLDQCSQSRHAVDGGMNVVRGNDYDLRMVFLRCTAGPQDGCDKHHRVKTGKEFHHWFFTQ